MGHKTEGRFIEYASQVPLNAFATFSLFSPVEIQAYYNIQHVINYHFLYPFYYWDLFMGIDDLSGYGWLAGDAWIHSLSFDIRKRVNHFTFGLNAGYRITQLDENDSKFLEDKIKIPWEPHLTVSPSIAFRYKIFSTELVGDGLFERYDTREVKLDDVFILSLRNNFNLHRNFKMGVNINNIFDMQYQRVSGMPKEGFNAEVVMRVLF